MIGLLVALAAAWANPEVTPGNLAQTICVPGWSTAWRAKHPPALPTQPGQVVDHVVSIQLGGNSTKANLQYQTLAEGKAKDRVENQLNALVCDGVLTLREGQTAIRRWRAK